MWIIIKKKRLGNILLKWEGVQTITPIIVWACPLMCGHVLVCVTQVLHDLKKLWKKKKGFSWSGIV